MVKRAHNLLYSNINFTLGKAQALQETVNSAISSSRSLLHPVQIFLQPVDLSLSIFNFKPNFHITLYQSGTLAQLQLNLHNHVLALCALYKALSVSLPESMSSPLSATVPSGTETLHLQLL
jgi:hypothetical protein